MSWKLRVVERKMARSRKTNPFTEWMEKPLVVLLTAASVCFVMEEHVLP